MDDAPTIDANDLPNAVNAFVPRQRVLDRFEMIRMLGRGGMGVVWLARDSQLDRDVALKFLPESVQSDPEAIADLKRETRRALELTHPNIVRIHDFLPDGKSACICMEYIDGETLAARKVARGCLEVDEIRAWLRQLFDGLRYAHEIAHVVHRDLKPANLMLGMDGRLKITDFGISSSVADSVSRLSLRKMTSGTPAYASPQQMNGDPPSPLDDIYAVGATLYDLLTGKPPFFRGDILHQSRTATPPPIRERRRELNTSDLSVPETWQTTIAACLAKDPAQRPQSIAELEHLLMQPVTVLKADPVAPATNVAPAKSRSVGVLTLASLLILGLLAAGGLWWMKRGPAVSDQPPQPTPVPVHKAPTAADLLTEARRLRTMDAPLLARERLLAALALEPDNRAVLEELTALGGHLAPAPPPSPSPPSPSPAPSPPSLPAASVALIASVKPSSTLNSQVSDDGRRNSYRAENAIDGNLATAWVAERDASEISLGITFKQEVLVTRFTIFPGYGKDADTFQKNNRVREFSLTFPSGKVHRFACEDRRERQTFVLPSPERCTSVVFKVLSTYQADRFKGDTPISEISF